MKFTVNSKEFKNAADRAMALIKPRMAVPMMECVTITADDSGIALFADTVEQKIQIHMNCYVENSGEVHIHRDDIKRICNVNGDITVESSGGKVDVRNDKRHVSVKSADVYGRKAGVCAEGELLFSVYGDSLLRMMGAVNAARDRTDPFDAQRPVLTGFNIDGKNNKLIGCDGFRMHAVELIVNTPSDSTLYAHNATIPGNVYDHMKKIVGKKHSEDIDVYTNGKSTFFVGSDFVYETRNIDGEFPAVYNRVLKDVDVAYSFRIEAASTARIAKEYSKDADHIFLVHNKGKIHTVMQSDTYNLSDAVSTIESEDSVMEDFVTAINPRYMHDALAAFADYTDMVKVSGDYNNGRAYGNIHPIVFSGSGLETLVLPVRSTYEKCVAAERFVAG